jgi:alcohol dehydrogenase
VEALNRDLNIPLYLQALQEADIPALAQAACHEAHTGYPVPRYMTQAQCEALIRGLLPPDAAAAAPAPRAARKTAGKTATKTSPKTSPKAASKTLGKTAPKSPTKGAVKAGKATPDKPRSRRSPT